MKGSKWILCPICHNKTRIKMVDNTECSNFLLYCPKCKQENLINIKNLKITIVREPDAKTQS